MSEIKMMSASKQEPEDQLDEEEERRTKLIVNYLPQNLTDAQLISIFSRVGPVLSAKVIRDQHTNYSYGYGFVEYTSPDDAASAIDQLKGLQIQNKRLGVAYVRSHDKDTLKNTNLYVTAIPDSHSTEEGVKNLFEKFGKIITVKLLTDIKTHEFRGTAFVRFDRREEAEKAIEALDGFKIHGSCDPLSVKVSEEHGKRKANNYVNYVNKPQFYNPGYHFQVNYSGYNGRGQFYPRRGRGGRGGYHPRGGQNNYNYKKEEQRGYEWN